MEAVYSIYRPATVEALRQSLTNAKAEITCFLENADVEDDGDNELACDEIQHLIQVLYEARSKLWHRSTDTDHLSPNAASNDVEELKMQLKALHEKHNEEKQQWEAEKLLIQAQNEKPKEPQQQELARNNLDAELLDTICELKNEVQSTRKAIQSAFYTSYKDENQIQTLGDDVREIESSVNLALVELRRASVALKETLAATRESLTDLDTVQSLGIEKVAGSRSNHLAGKPRSGKTALEASLKKQLDIETKKRVRAEAEIEILNDQADAYMDQILDLQTENVQLILKADDRSRSILEADEHGTSDLTTPRTNASSQVSEVQSTLDESANWDQLPAFVRNLYQRCEMLEAERQEVLESTVELLESSRAANIAKVEAAYNQAIMEAERNFGLWLEDAICSKCSSRFEPRVAKDKPLSSPLSSHSSTQVN